MGLRFLDECYRGASRESLVKGDLGNIRQKMYKEKLSLTTLGDVKTEFTPSHYESYIQIFGDPATAIDKYMRYKFLNKREADNPTFSGVIDEEEFTAYQFPTDSNLWEIVVDPTGMAYRTIYVGIDSLSLQSNNYMMEQVRNIRPEDMTNVETLGPVPRLNDCKVIRVRVIETIDKNNAQGLIPGEEHDATILENGQLLIGDGTGRARIYPVDLFEVMPLGAGDTEMKKQIITINGKNISIYQYDRICTK